MKNLLIVYHTQTDNTGRLARAVLNGANNELVTEIETRFLMARDAGPDDLLWADGLLLGTPENFGYMSGGMKDFLDRLRSRGENPFITLCGVHQRRQRRHWRTPSHSPYR